jgi:hypothetical protein
LHREQVYTTDYQFSKTSRMDARRRTTMPLPTPPRKDGNNEPAYEMRIWSYPYAPMEYRTLFAAPEVEEQAYIVYQRRVVDNWWLEWIAPNGVWWQLWHYEKVHELDEHTKVYLLVEMVRGKSP